MHLNIRGKLIGGFGAVLVMSVVAGYIGWHNTTTFSSEFSDLYSHNLQNSVRLATVERALWQLRIALPMYMLGEQQAREQIKADSGKWLRQVEEGIAAYRASGVGPEEQQILREWDEPFAKYVRARPEFFALLDAGKAAEAKEFHAKETNPAAAKAVAALGKLNDLQSKLAAEKNERVTSRATSSGILLVSVVLAAVGAGMVISVLVGASLSRPVGEVVEVLEQVAEGDLTVALPETRRDEIGRMALALNAAVTRMRSALDEVKASAARASVGSHELSAAAERLSSGAQQQASSLEETAASLEEMTGTVKQNADNARQASQLAVGSRGVAEKGGQVVTQAVASMKEINAASKRIADIITTIDEIAFQTNLLALNAAVEAARAGEQGRGFAVVAAEVRNLAQRSATAAKEIKHLIEDSVQKVAAGSELVNRSGETLNEIVTSVKRVTDIIAEIAAASEEQTTGIDQINKAVVHIDQITQSNASQTEELSSTAQALAAQADELQNLVARFRVGEDRAPARIAAPAVLEGRRTLAISPRPAAVAPAARRARRDEPVFTRAQLAGGGGNGSPRGKDDEFAEF